MRLRNKHNGTQINVPADKAHRLIAEGIYQAVPDAEQPPEPTVRPLIDEQTTGRGRGNRGRTSIAAALKDGAGPLWDTPTG